MKLRGSDRLWTWWDRIQSLTGRHGVCLLYHRISDDSFDPFQLGVTPANFEAHMRVLSSRYRVVTLREIGSQISAGRVQAGTVAITFDDGYADNYLVALNILHKHGIPATVFVTTGLLGSPRSFWWDRLEALLLRPGRVPPRITVNVEGAARSWEMRDTTTLSRDSFLRHVHWTGAEPSNPTARHEAFREIYGIVKALAHDGRQAVIAEIEGQVEMFSDPRPDCRPLTRDELISLASSPTIDIGAHTVHHEVLARLAPGRQEEEIWSSRAVLENLLNREITSFSYPYGQANDYTKETVRFVYDAGFLNATTTVERRVRGSSDPMQIPRVCVRDWDEETFERRMIELLGF